MGKGRKYKKTNRTKITTKNAISKSELRAARRQEEVQINKATSSKREAKRIENKMEDIEMVAELSNPVVDPARIIEEFEADNTNINSIAKAYNIDKDEVLSILVCGFYRKGFSIVKCSKKFGITAYRVRKILEGNNIEMRPSGNYSSKLVDFVEVTKENQQVNSNNDESDKSFDINLADNNDISTNPKKNSTTAKSTKKSTVKFAEQEYTNEKLINVEFTKFQNDIVVAGLVKDRHDIPFVNKYIFDTLTDKEFSNPNYVQNRAKGFINAYVRPNPVQPAKTLILYCTGLQLALSAVVSECALNKVNLITMHWDPNTKSYIPQNTLTIFGKVPDISSISPLKNMEDRYGGGVFTYRCQVKDLIKQESCVFISTNTDISSRDIDSIILFDKEFPDAEVWEVYSDLIKLSRSDEISKKCHNIQMGLIDVSLAGYTWGDTISKSYNYRTERTTRSL